MPKNKKLQVKVWIKRQRGFIWFCLLTEIWSCGCSFISKGIYYRQTKKKKKDKIVSRDANLRRSKIWRLSLLNYSPECQHTPLPTTPPTKLTYDLGHYTKSYMKFCVSVLYICSQDSFRKEYVLSCMSQTFLGQSFDTSKAYQLHTICILERLYEFDFFPHCIHRLTYWENICCCSVMMLLHPEYALCSR